MTSVLDGLNIGLGFLNDYRILHNADNYFFGFLISKIEPALVTLHSFNIFFKIILITDGGKISNLNGAFEFPTSLPKSQDKTKADLVIYIFLRKMTVT